MKRPICLFPLALVPLLACDTVKFIGYVNR